MRRLVFAANWKLHHGPDEARDYARRFLTGFAPQPARDYWFFPSAVSLEATARAFAGAAGVSVGIQDAYWEPKGAFTGANSMALAKAAGGAGALVGHSERRHVFGETDAETGRKVKAALGSGLTPILCVGEQLAERDTGKTQSVVIRQLEAGIDGLDPAGLARVIVAYEPVWAIGTGRTATPADAGQVHRAIRSVLTTRGHGAPLVLYGGSVNAANAAALLAEPELDGVLVGGASLDPDGWRKIVETDAPS